jgi:hypothetical protein
MRTILHFIPDSALAYTYQGSYKDILSRVNWFRTQDAEYRQILLSEDPATLDRLPPSGEVCGILVEYTHYPRTVAILRRQYPGAFLATRAHNIEPLQHLHVHGWRTERGPLWLLYGMCRRLYHDMLCKRYCDAIYSISSYENRVYWDRLPGRARIEWLPYFCPEHLLPQHPLDFARRTTIGCLPGDLRARRNRDMAVRFIEFARMMKAAGAPYEFVMTGNVSASDLPSCDAVRLTGMLDDLASLLGELRAVAVLSPIGYGLKTTAVDALAAGAYTLAHPAIVRRSPKKITPAMIAVETPGPVNVAEARRVTDALASPPPCRQIHSELKARCLELLQRDFGPKRRGRPCFEF